MIDRTFEDVVKALADAFLDVKAAEAHIARYRELLTEREAALAAAKDNVTKLNATLARVMYSAWPTDGSP
jgi:SHS2 domain-containing protein